MKVYLVAETEAENEAVMELWEIGNHLPLLSSIKTSEKPIVYLKAKIGDDIIEEDVIRIVNFEKRTIEEVEDVAGIVNNSAFPF